MSCHSVTLALSIILIVPPLTAQVGVVVGPSPVPLGCPITIVISNDGLSPVTMSVVCPFFVMDAMGVTIYSGPSLLPNPCPSGATVLNPGSNYIMSWPQLDSNSAPVPPGNYTVNVGLPPFPGGGSQTLPIIIGGTDAAIALRGVPRIGSLRGLDLCAPLDPGRTFILAASLSSFPGIPTCAGTVPLTPDPLFELSLDPSNSVFLGFQGTLDGSGQSTSPAVAIPNQLSIVGATVHLAFVVYDPLVPCQILRISSPLSVTLL